MLGDPLRRHLRRDPPVADATGALERDVGVAADQDRDRSLHRAGFGVHGGQVVVLAVELDEVALGAPQRPHQRDVLLAAGAPAVPRHAHGLGFLAQPADPDAVDDPTPE